MRSFEIKQVFLTDSDAVEVVARVQSASNIADGINGACAVDVELLIEELTEWGDQEYVLLAYLDGEAIGCAEGFHDSSALAMYVLPEYRGQGIENVLLPAIEAIYRLNGVTVAAAGVAQADWLSELLQDNGYRYQLFNYDDMLVKDLTRGSVSSDRALWCRT